MNHRQPHSTPALRALCLAVCALMLALTPAALADAESAPDDAYVYTYDGMTVSYEDGGLLTTQDDEPALVVYYDFTNDKASAETFIYSFAVTVYQDGIECDPAYTWDFDVAPEDAYTALVSIKDGATVRVAKYFKIKNTESPVDVELSRMFSFGSSPMTITLSLPGVTVSSSSTAPDDMQDISVAFTIDEAEDIAAAALLAGKSVDQWLHDAAMAAISGD